MGKMLLDCINLSFWLWLTAIIAINCLICSLAEVDEGKKE